MGLQLPQGSQSVLWHDAKWYLLGTCSQQWLSLNSLSYWTDVAWVSIGHEQLYQCVAHMSNSSHTGGLRVSRFQAGNTAVPRKKCLVSY